MHDETKGILMTLKPVVTLSSLGLLTILAACGDPAVSNPDYFSYQFRGGQLNGSYNPTGYDANRVQGFIQSECVDKKLASYDETPASNGLVDFTATCAGGTINPSGNASIQS